MPWPYNNSSSLREDDKRLTREARRGGAEGEEKRYEFSYEEIATRVADVSQLQLLNMQFHLARSRPERSKGRLDFVTSPSRKPQPTSIPPETFRLPFFAR